MLSIRTKSNHEPLYPRKQMFVAFQILCRVVELMDEANTCIWTAGSVVEELRTSLGTWKLLLKSSEISKFKGDAKTRAPLMSRLKDADFAETAFKVVPTITAKSIEPV